MNLFFDQIKRAFIDCLWKISIFSIIVVLFIDGNSCIKVGHLEGLGPIYQKSIFKHMWTDTQVL